MTTTTTTHPFGAIAEQMQAAWECRPSLLAFCGVPENTTELRARWFSVFRSVYANWLREINHFSLSEEEAEQVVDERVGVAVNDCASPCIDSFHLWAFCRLTEKYSEASLFEFPDSRQYVGGPYDAMAQETA